jgi:hypothetical protein
MNDFDRLLEMKLRHLLDPVVAGRPPARRARQHRPQHAILTVEAVGLELAAETIAVDEPVVVTDGVASARQLKLI